jgi:hypothetical protein
MLPLSIFLCLTHADRFSVRSFIKYNAVLRGISGRVPYLHEQMRQLCLGNRYATTLHNINSCIVKLGKLMPAQCVYRGISGGLLPDGFWRRNEFNVCGGVECVNRCIAS